MSGIDQKEYLKKYLGIGKRSGEKKKKKKTKKLGPNRLTIVDDDVDVLLNEQIKEDLNAAEDEDAPQIVSVIDDRPPSLRVDEVSKNKLWLPIGETIDISAASVGVKFEGNIKLEGKKTDNIASKSLKKERKESEHNGGDILHPSEIKQEKSEDISPPRKRASHLSDSSPPRKIKRERSEDISPPRKSNRHSPLGDRDTNVKREKSPDVSPPRRSNRRSPTPDRDISPPRRKRTAPNSPESTRRRTVRNGDISPPRRSNRRSPTPDRDNSPPRRRRRNSTNSPSRKQSRNDDISPSHKSSRTSPSRTTIIKRERSADISPPRRPNRRSSPTPDRDISPPRRRRNSPNSPESTRKKQSRNSDISPSRHSKDKPGRKKSRWAVDEDQTEKLKKTLDGKTAGLQNATDLVAETSQLKQKEDELFRNMSAEISGANAATVVRSKKKEVDWEEEERKRKKEAENKEKYDRWGKGLKQVGDANEKFQNELYEMSKPLARYADDEDLERYLKEQERDGDPMLAYLRQKKRKKAVKEGKPEAQVYQGDAPANRFGIRPGYRWDGVDRSNGYEKEWFEVQNARKASVEESYKWSTEDM